MKCYAFIIVFTLIFQSSNELNTNRNSLDELYIYIKNKTPLRVTFLGYNFESIRENCVVQKEVFENRIMFSVCDWRFINKNELEIDIKDLKNIILEYDLGDVILASLNFKSTIYFLEKKDNNTVIKYEVGINKIPENFDFTKYRY